MKKSLLLFGVLVMFIFSISLSSCSKKPVCKCEAEDTYSGYVVKETFDLEDEGDLEDLDDVFDISEPEDCSELEDGLSDYFDDEYIDVSCKEKDR